MKIKLLLTLYCVSFLSDGVSAEGESEIKKGHYPFMAFIYYPDEAIIESTGRRFLRGAVLVKPEWLISSSVGPVMINDTPLGFPRKTLLARMGAVSIDANFTLNEDEDEQEREVIQIVRPHNYSEAQWWRNDLTLLKTLLPFNVTSAVAIANIRTRSGIIGNSNCYIIFYAITKNFGNWTEERVLMQMLVELQSPTHDSCGSHFYEDTMLCAADSEESKHISYNSEFCQGNSGGPLICENEVTGLQTYIENNCKPPHLYQLLSAWDNFITCGIEDKCNEEHCANVCTLVHKDAAVTEDASAATLVHDLVNLVSAEPTKAQTEQITIISYTTSEPLTEEYDTPTRVPTLTPALELVETVDTTTTTTTTETSTVITTDSTTTTTTVVTTVESSPYEETETPAWPKDKFPERSKNYEDNLMKIERKTNMEAQKQDVIVKPKSAAERNTLMLSSLLIGLAYLI